MLYFNNSLYQIPGIGWQSYNLRQGGREFDPYLLRPCGVALDVRVQNHLVG